MSSPIQDIKSLLDDVEDKQLFEVMSKGRTCNAENPFNENTGL